MSTQMIDMLLILCLGHLAADFMLQSDAMVRRKKQGSASAYLQHGVIHGAAYLALAAATHPTWIVRIRFQAIVLALVVAHLLIDFCKDRMTAAGTIGDTVATFLADQSLHLATIAAATFLFAGMRPEAVAEWLRALEPHREKILAMLVVYFAVVFAGGYLIRYLTRPLTRHLPSLGEEDKQSLRNAGMYIGWLERILVLTAVLLRSPATVGLVLTAKSIVRYPEIKSGRFAEYFLIGTLLSILLALLGGVLLLKILDGQVRFTP